MKPTPKRRKESYLIYTNSEDVPVTIFCNGADLVLLPGEELRFSPGDVDSSGEEITSIEVSWYE